MTKLVRLGTNINGTSETNYQDHGWGVCQVWAKSRYGKTSLARTMVCRMAKYRPIIVFDFYGDWIGMRDYNWLIQDPRCNRNYETAMPERIDNLYIADNPSFEISDFKWHTDWLSWGMPEQASKAVAELARCKNAHYNNPDDFEQILMSLPIDSKEAEIFEAKYKKSGLPTVRVFPQSRESAIVRWQYLKHFFGTRRSVKHWGELLLHKNHVVVNFDIKSDPVMGIAKARAFTGKILSELLEKIPGTNMSYIERIKPLVVLEECDKLLPKTNDEKDRESSILNAVVEIGLKMQRSGASLLMITQDPDRLDTSIQRMYHSIIMGRVPRGTPHEDLTQELRWDPGSNFRQFCLLKENGQYEYFIPDFTPCK